MFLLGRLFAIIAQFVIATLLVLMSIPEMLKFLHKRTNYAFLLEVEQRLIGWYSGKTSKSLEWEVRYKIALGVARGLHYLHKCCKHRIIHRDIKASNVLLGPDYEPQVSKHCEQDLALSKFSAFSLPLITNGFVYVDNRFWASKMAS